MNRPQPMSIQELCQLFKVDIKELPNMAAVGPLPMIEKNLETFKDVFKKAYRKIAIECHPDKNPPAEKVEYFKKITSIYRDLRKLKVIARPRPVRPRVVIRTTGFSTASSSTTTGGWGGGSWYWSTNNSSGGSDGTGGF